MSNSRKGSLSVQYMTRIAILGALASILFYWPEIPIFPPIYKLDLSNIPVLLGAFSMGPLPGLAILVIKDLTGMLHSSNQFVGELADFLMSAAYVLPAALIYQRHKNRKNALIGMLTGTVVMVVISVLVNWKIMFPFYTLAMGMPMEAIVGLFQKLVPIIDSEWKVLAFATAPFNLLKGVILSILTFVMYKRLSPLLHVRGAGRKPQAKPESAGNTAHDGVKRKA
ncbi:MAG: ECF transporter S component [Clostridia bacterium]|nr:ECF transporter S component [Clostridia bacterium]